MLPLLALLAGCTSALTVKSNIEGAEVFITDYMPSPNERPTTYEMSGKTPMYCELEYYAWEKYYVWVGKPGYETEVRPIKNEVKLLPIVGAVCIPVYPFSLGLLVWAYGPEEDAINVKLER